MRTILAIPLLLAATAVHAQWEIEESHTTTALRGIDNVGGGIAWASGAHGTVLRTEDGGYLWQTCNIPPGAEKLDFRGVQAFDQNTAIVMSSGPGDQSRLYKTTDGCQSWKLLLTNPDKEGFWDALRFGANSGPSPTGGVNRCFGVLVGDPVGGHFPVFLTSDCGETWRREAQASPAALPTGESLFAASNSSLTVTGAGVGEIVSGGKAGARLLTFWVGGVDAKTKDEQPNAAESPRRASGSQSSYSLPNPEPSESSGAFSIAQGNHTIVIVGGDYSRPERGMSWFKADGNRGTPSNWTLSKMPPHGYRSAVAYDSVAKIWIAVGPNGTDISTDNGRSWGALTPAALDVPGADKNWNALSLPFVVGPNGRIGKFRSTALPAPGKRE